MRLRVATRKISFRLRVICGPRFLKAAEVCGPHCFSPVAANYAYGFAVIWSLGQLPKDRPQQVKSDQRVNFEIKIIAKNMTGTSPLDFTRISVDR
uniref:Uncharacterized protein n=1 Tax=Romanomermis culicivorax TaxID=13658 RepID=A0A915ILW9_ROMCU